MTNSNFQKKDTGFVPSLIFSFITIIIICTTLTGLLYYGIVQRFMKEKVIESNNKLLNQYSSSIDIALVETVESISLKMMHDINGSYYLNRFFNEPIDAILPEVPKVSSYLNDMSVLNPLVFSLSIYYSNSDLLISTDYIRHTIFKPIEAQKDLKHYYDIVQKAGNMEIPDDKNITLIFDYGRNLGFKVSEVQVNRYPETIIHAVRVTYGHNKTVKGAVVVTVSGDIFKNFLSKYAPEDLGSIFIFDEEGVVITHTDNDFIGRNISEMFYHTELINRKNKSGYFVSKEAGVPAVVSYQPSSYGNWTYVSVASMDAISEVSKYIGVIVILVAFFSALVGMVISVLRARKLAKPIKSIANYCLRSPYNSENVTENEYSLISGTLNNMESMMHEKENELKKVFPMIKMNFLSSLFSGNPPEVEEINIRMKVLGIGLSHKFFCPIIIKLESLKKSGDVVKYEIGKLNILKRIEIYFMSNDSECLYYEKDNIIHILVNFRFTESELYDRGRAFLDKSNTDLPGLINIKKQIVFGKIDTDIRRMGSTYKIALNGLNYFYVFPEKKMLVFREILEFEEKTTSSTKLLLNNLSNSLKSLNCIKSINDLEYLIDTLRNGNYNYYQIYNALYTSVSLIEEFASTSINNDVSFEKDFLSKDNILDFEIWIKSEIKKAFSSIAEKCNSNKELILRIKQFIEDNIQNSQLSLEYIAEELNINYKHLSRVFKNETGVKFIDYLMNSKLNHSRSLLINTELKVEEIAEIMGYSTSQYFISRFKLMFGYTPRIYREKYKEGELFEIIDGKDNFPCN